MGGWWLKKLIGRGGNGQVWRARNADGDEAAVKILTKVKRIAYTRFRDEVETLDKNADVPGILPVLGRSVPRTLPEGEHAWFVMPLATPLALDADERELGMVRRVGLMVDIAKTLVVLHDRKIAHRDLKPANMLMYEGRPHLCDFGLVHYPGKSDLTGVLEILGPRWALAPELRRHGSEVDPFPTDVYVARLPSSV